MATDAVKIIEVILNSEYSFNLMNYNDMVPVIAQFEPLVCDRNSCKLSFRLCLVQKCLVPVWYKSIER